MLLCFDNAIPFCNTKFNVLYSTDIFSHGSQQFIVCNCFVATGKLMRTLQTFPAVVSSCMTKANVWQPLMLELDQQKRVHGWWTIPKVYSYHIVLCVLFCRVSHPWFVKEQKQACSIIGGVGKRRTVYLPSQIKYAPTSVTNSPFSLRRFHSTSAYNLLKADTINNGASLPFNISTYNPLCTLLKAW